MEDITKSSIFLKIHNISIRVTQYSIKSYIHVVSCLSEYNCEDTVTFHFLMANVWIIACQSLIRKHHRSNSAVRTIYVSIIVTVMQNHNNLIRNCINIYIYLVFPFYFKNAYSLINDACVFITLSSSIRFLKKLFQESVQRIFQ